MKKHGWSPGCIIHTECPIHAGYKNYKSYLFSLLVIFAYKTTNEMLELNEIKVGRNNLV